MAGAQQWEYFVISLQERNEATLSKLLSDYGKGGWERVVAVPLGGMYGTIGKELYFKRPVQGG